MKDFIEIVIILEDKEIHRTILSGTSFNLIVNDKSVLYKNSGKIHNGRYLYEEVESEVEKAFKRGETIQYKSNDVEHWADWVAESETDRPSYSYRLNWRVKNG